LFRAKVWSAPDSSHGRRGRGGAVGRGAPRRARAGRSRIGFLPPRLLMLWRPPKPKTKGKVPEETEDRLGEEARVLVGEVEVLVPVGRLLCPVWRTHRSSAAPATGRRVPISGKAIHGGSFFL
jgi:hypothetical protein